VLDSERQNLLRQLQLFRIRLAPANLLCLCVALMANPADAFGTPRDHEARAFSVCLPPLYEGGRRLHVRGELEVADLSLLLAQHQVCWSEARSPDEKRIFLIGDSNVWGHPLSVDESYGAVLQDRLDRGEDNARVFNLGFILSYQLKDALVLSRSLDFAPDLIVYGASLADRRHVAPLLWPPAIGRFFEANGWRFAGDRASEFSGLEEPAGVYGALSADRAGWLRRWALLRESGRFVRALLRESAQRWVETRSSRAAAERLKDGPATGPLHGRREEYPCARVEERFAASFRGWQSWSILPYLESVQREAGVPVLVVNWPLPHEPRDDCYNARHPTEAVEAYNELLERETRRRGLAYLDLHDLLPLELFTDWVHLGVEGQAKLAATLAPAISGWLGSGSFDASDAARSDPTPGERRP
jgi:lysophospholipase L1-like esterase